VIDALLRLAEHNPRAAVRGMVELTNPGMTLEEIRTRIDASLDYSSGEAILVRHRWFYGSHATEHLRALGDRLWVARWESEWSPRAVTNELRLLLPESHMETLADGAIARPDLTADLVRRALAES
jgi:hypothetical protein